MDDCWVEIWEFRDFGYFGDQENEFDIIVIF